MRSRARRSTAWTDRHFDPARSLLWNPPRSFSDDLPEHSVHIVPQPCAERRQHGFEIRERIHTTTA